jgi:hypothetical protein
MVRYAAIHFNCPGCRALYHVVKTEAGLGTTNGEATCQICGGGLPAREGKYILKYFLLRRARRYRPKSPQISLQKHS